MIVRLDECVTQAEFGRLVGVHQSVVSRLVTDGTLQAGGTAGDWLMAYCERLRTVAAGRYTEGPLDLAQERAALARAQAALVEHRLAVARGTYAPISVLAEVLATASQAVAERLDHLPGHLRKMCPRLTEDERDEVVAVIAQARNEWVRATAELVAQQLAADDADEPADDAPGGAGNPQGATS